MDHRIVAALLVLAVSCGNDSAKTNIGAPDLAGADMGTAQDVSESDLSTPVKDTGRPTPDMAMDQGSALDVGPDMPADVGVDMGPSTPPLDIVWPTTPQDYADTARITYITSMRFPPLANNMATCCFDYGARSKNPGLDNSFANLNQTLTGFGIDLNDVLEDSLTSGSLVALLDHRALDGADDADGFVLAWLRGEFAAGTDYTTAAAGNGEFLLDPASLEATGASKLFFDPASMQGGQMAAGPAALSLLLPVLLESLELRVEGARMTGEATIGVDGVAYVNGTIAGYVAVQEVFDNLNAIIAGQCQCLGATGDFFTTTGDGDWSGQCVSDPAALGCDQDLCVALGGSQLSQGGYCSISATLLPQLADIDTNGDTSVYESISLGLAWEGVRGTITGLRP